MRRGVLVLLLGMLAVAASAEATTVVQRRVLDCGARTSAECSDAVLLALGHSPALRLKAAGPADTVHGAVTIDWCAPMPCEVRIQVEVYEHDDPPTSGRRSHLTRPAVMPSEAEVRRRVETLSLP